MRQTLRAAFALLALAAPLQAQEAAMPFGTEQDVAYAQLLWDLMQAERLAGPNMVRSFPYEGTEPHGMMLETYFATGTIGGHTGDLVVKRNFGPEGVTADQVLADPAAHLGAYTVMYRREAGYDPENLDWFWVMYAPDGAVARNEAGMALAGRVAQGMDVGCIACHKGAAGDMVFVSDHLIAR